MPPVCIRQGQCASVNSKQPFADGVGLVPCFLLLFFSDCAFTRPHFNLLFLVTLFFLPPTHMPSTWLVTTNWFSSCTIIWFLLKLSDHSACFFVCFLVYVKPAEIQCFLLWLGMTFANEEELSAKFVFWQTKMLRKKKSEKWLLNVPFPSIFQKIICHYRAPLRLQLRKKTEKKEQLWVWKFYQYSEKKSQKCNTIRRKLYCSMWKHRMATGIKEYKQRRVKLRA